MPSLTYHDAYLAGLVTNEREARALADVDAIGDVLMLNGMSSSSLHSGNVELKPCSDWK